MLTEEMMRAAVQERNQAVENFEREARYREFLRETDATLIETPRSRRTWRTFVPSIRQLVGALGRA